MIIKIAILALALTALALSARPLAQDAKPPAAKPAGPTVQLSLIVTDGNDKSLNTISKDDIRLVEDKVEQTVLSVEPDARPVDLGIALDASGSTRRFLNPIVKAASLIVVNRQPKDEIFIERFISTDKIEKLQDFSSDEKVLLNALDSMYVEAGQSAVIDAVYTAVNYVAEHNRNSDRRKAVVIFTDGEDRNSYYNIEKLLKLLHKEKVQIFVVGFIMDLTNQQTAIARAGNKDRAIKLLNTLAEETGGRVFFPRDNSELSDSVAQIVHDLRGQFQITYQSTNADKKDFRKVDVNLSSAGGEKSGKQSCRVAMRRNSRQDLQDVTGFA
jgi:Ca-activated chloride channel family protein